MDTQSIVDAIRILVYAAGICFFGIAVQLVIVSCALGRIVRALEHRTKQEAEDSDE